MSAGNTSPRTLETLLETGFGATGASFGEKVSSVETKLPAPLVVQLRAVYATSKQLETGGTVDISGYRRMLESSAEQLELLAKPRLEATAKPPEPSSLPSPAHLPRIGTTATPKAARVSRLRVWLYDTRQRIPKRAHAISRTWRIPGTVLGLALGGAAGWFAAGIGGAIAGALALGIIAFLALSENAVARGLWAQTRAVEGTFAVLRFFGRAALATLAIVVVGVIVFFVTRLWNVR
jgi:hypothetical protein